MCAGIGWAKDALPFPSKLIDGYILIYFIARIHFVSDFYPKFPNIF